MKTTKKVNHHVQVILPASDAKRLHRLRTAVDNMNTMLASTEAEELYLLSNDEFDVLNEFDDVVNDVAWEQCFSWAEQGYWARLAKDENGESVFVRPVENGNSSILPFNYRVVHMLLNHGFHESVKKTSTTVIGNLMISSVRVTTQKLYTQGSTVDDIPKSFVIADVVVSCRYDSIVTAHEESGEVRNRTHTPTDIRRDMNRSHRRDDKRVLHEVVRDVNSGVIDDIVL